MVKGYYRQGLVGKTKNKQKSFNGLKKKKWNKHTINYKGDRKVPLQLPFPLEVFCNLVPAKSNNNHSLSRSGTYRMDFLKGI